jgi:microcystin-dependent protein
MSEPFMSEIRIMSFNFAPQGWAMCGGQLLPINQNQALFSLLGTQYGGNGQTNFALPDFRGRIPMHVGSSHTLAEAGGQESHTVTISEMPAHTHVLSASSTQGDSVNPNFSSTPHILAKDPGNAYSNNFSGLIALNAASLAAVGGSQPHNNMMPYLALTFCIALQGIFPSQN